MGASKATKELIDLCNLSKGKYVLDVGCGVGLTSCYITRRYDCRVVGVDISERMIYRAIERARKEGVEDRVEFRVADAQNLPFQDDLFDVVIGESAITFVEDKNKAVREYARVTKSKGYVGLNEETMIKAPAPKEVIEYAFLTWPIKGEIPTSEGWKELLEDAGLKDIIVRTHEFKGALSDYIEGVRPLGFKGALTSFYKFLRMYLESSSFRKYIKGRYTSLPKNFFEYLGYGIYVGRK